ncbi:MAG TPA: hypothetical protein VKH35_15120 [Thermoanaerobaculia bacterium]|nr:hypothetical protein [Thermoanaerobaculia bacterium]
MRILFAVGLIVLALGIASLFVPIPTRQHHGIKAGNISVGFETTERHKVAPAVTAALIGAGAVLMIAGGMRRRT